MGSFGLNLSDAA